MSLRRWGARLAPRLSQALFAAYAPSRHRRMALGAVAAALDAALPTDAAGLVRALEARVAAKVRERSVKGEVQQQVQQALFAKDALERIAGRELEGGDSADLAIVAQAWCRIAAADVTDGAAFVHFVQALRLLNGDVLAALAARPRPYLAVHISCAPRLERARQSVASFSGTLPDVQHIIAIGDETLADHRYRYDAASGVLAVPAPDVYEALPGKVVATLALAALLPNLRAVIKLDDDHRLVDATRLERQLKGSERPGPAQYGRVFESPTLFSGNRCWHMGKCRDPVLNGRPSAAPRPLTWATGEAGYILNRAAVRVLLFNRVYARDYIDAYIFEDTLVSGLIMEFGGVICPLPGPAAIGAVSDY